MRYYTIETEAGTVRLPSVTTILDVTMPVADRFRLEQARAMKPANFAQKQQAGRDRGNYCHRYMDARLHGRRMGHGQYGRWLKHLDPLLKGIVLCNPGPCYSEELVYDLELGYVGRFDFLLRLPGWGDPLCLLDLKTCGYKAWPQAIHSAQLQAAAYAYAWNRQTHILHADMVASIHLSPYGLQIVTNEGQALADLYSEFCDRLHWFGSRLSELQSSTDELVFCDV